jgi:hypothetical protein
MGAVAQHKAPVEPIARLAEATAVTTQPVVYGVAGLTFMGITFQDWVLIGTAILLTFNIIFAGVKLRDMLRGGPGK